MIVESSEVSLMPPAQPDDARWRAVLGRDPAADGAFVYSVRTTGIYCRPTCPSRRPRPENVRFHATAGEAEAAGFRPCRRCDPAGEGPAARLAGLVERACRAIEAGRRGPEPRRPGRVRRPESPPLPPGLQGPDRRDPEGLCRRPPRRPGPRGAGPGRDRHRGDLRRRIQVERPVLRRRDGESRHDPDRIPRRRRGGRDPVRDRPDHPRPDPRRRLRGRPLRHPLSATTRRPWPATSRTASRRPG